MAACDELESMILDRVAGTLPATETAALQAHLDGCPRCRAWAASCEEAVQRVALPEPSEAERLALTGLPARARAAFRERRGRPAWLRSLVGVGAAAAVVAAALALSPPVTHRGRGAARAAALEDVDASELASWALADPLEEQGLTALADEASLDDESIEPSDAAELDLDLEQME